MKARAFLFGLIAGALAGLLLVEFGIGLPLPAALAIAVGCAVRRRPTGAAGTLIGWGALWIALFVNAARACAADQNCGDSPPSVVPWVSAGLILVLTGIVVLALSVRRHAAPGV